MAHNNEYSDNMVAMLELIWGDGYMAPGGPGNVARLLEGTQPAGKRILDIGCGVGGPALEMLQTHGAQVVGIDLEQPLVERAKARARERGLQEHCQFLTVSAGRLPFADGSFDIVTSSGAITQTQDKVSLLSEAQRVLVPGGTMSCYEWMRSAGNESEEMAYWIETEGLTYAFATLADYRKAFKTAGFDNISAVDASDWYRTQARLEYEKLKGDLYDDMVRLLGTADADHFVENWRAMLVVINSGEMRQAYCKGQTPVA